MQRFSPHRGSLADSAAISANAWVWRSCQLAAVVLTLMLSATIRADDAAVRKEAQSVVSKFLNQHCVKCHGEKVRKSGVDLQALAGVRAVDFELWQDVLNNVQRGEMPPPEARQPDAEERQKFLAAIRSELDRVQADADSRDFRFRRLSNVQIAWSLRDLLGIDRDFSGELTEDPVGKHGESLQSRLELTDAHMEAYLAVLQKAVAEAIPDLERQPKFYQLHGNDWERQHYLNRNDLAFSTKLHHRRYLGPRWLEDAFQIPLPPNHFFRIYIDDNRDEGAFRVRVRLRNEPPQEGGSRTKHEMTVFMDKGFKSSMHAVGSFTVEPHPGTQVFEVFGNVLDFPGVDPAPIRDGEDPYGTSGHFRYRFLSIQNCSPLRSKFDKPVKNDEWVIHGDGHLVRADDQWIDAWGEEFGKQNWLRRSHAGSQHPTRGKPSVYKQVMQDTSHVVIERIEFDLPWQWPPRGVRQFLRGDKLTDDSIRAGVLRLAERAWRRPLLDDERTELEQRIQAKLAASPAKLDALRDLVAGILADARFLFLSDAEKTNRLRNHELVARLAAFLWRSIPDERLREIAASDEPIGDDELQRQVARLIADPRSERFVANFAADWLAFHRFEQIAVNPNYYGWWNPHFKHYMKQESIAFLATLLRENLSCLNCLSSDFVVVNDMMAKFYGLPQPASGHRFSRVPAPPQRGGVLTQASFLLAHSNGEDSHAVHRGIWLRSRLLGDPPRDPPPGVPALDDLKRPEADRVSIKERLALHRTGICYDCHKNIDPWGIAMEAYDATGKVRQQILRIPANDKKRLNLPVVQEAEIRDRSINGMRELQHYLRDDCHAEFSRGFSAALLSFALGRPLNYKDDHALKTITTHFEQHDHRMSDLIQAIVMLPEFRHPHKVKP